MKKKFIAMVLALTGVVAMAQAADKVAPLIHYTWGGGLSNIKVAELRVEASGQVIARYEKQAQCPSDYRFSLDEDEVVALLSLVRTVKFFDQPTNDTSFATDVGESLLTINIGNDRRTLRYRFRPALKPLTQELWKLIQQGIVTSELELKGDVYEAMVASSSQLLGAKVYNPRLLIQPLKKHITQCQGRQKLEWGLTGLAWLVTEEQWLGFVSSQLEKASPERKSLLLGVLSSHPFYGNIPDSHARILLPLLTSVLDSYSETKGQIESKTDESLGIVCQFIGAKKYEQSLSVLTRLKQVHSDSEAGRWAGWAIESINAEKKKAQP